MNRGAKQTLTALKDRGLSINQGAALVDSDAGTFSKILRAIDGRKPGRALSMRIFAVLGVSPSLWDEELPGEPDSDETANVTNPTRVV